MTCPLTKDELREALSIAGEQRQRLHAWQIARFMDEIEQIVIRRSLWKNDPEKGKRNRTTPKPTRPWAMTAEHWPVFFFPLTLDEAKEICKYSDRGREVRRKIQKLFKRYSAVGTSASED
jgi:hypothetical protein